MLQADTEVRDVKVKSSVEDKDNTATYSSCPVIREHDLYICSLFILLFVIYLLKGKNKAKDLKANPSGIIK